MGGSKEPVRSVVEVVKSAPPNRTPSPKYCASSSSANVGSSRRQKQEIQRGRKQTSRKGEVARASRNPAVTHRHGGLEGRDRGNERLSARRQTARMTHSVR